MGKGGGEPADQIEKQIGKMSQIIFDVVPENPQEPHVANHMQPSTVHEHGSKDWKERCRQTKVSRSHEGVGHITWHDPELIDKCQISTRTLNCHPLLEHENNNVQGDDEIIYERRAESWLVVANRNHEPLLAVSS